MTIGRSVQYVKFVIDTWLYIVGNKRRNKWSCIKHHRLCYNKYYCGKTWANHSLDIPINHEHNITYHFSWYPSREYLLQIVYLNYFLKNRLYKFIEHRCPTNIFHSYYVVSPMLIHIWTSKGNLKHLQWFKMYELVQWNTNWLHESIVQMVCFVISCVRGK